MLTYIPKVHKTDSLQVEVYFSDACYAPLFKSALKANSFYCFDHDFTMGDIQNISIDIPIPSTKKIRIWASHSDIHEYLSFLYICTYFKGEDISVVFVDDYTPDLFSLSAATYNEVSELLKYEKILSAIDRNEYIQEWERLCLENGELRIFKNKKVISVSHDYFNEKIESAYLNNSKQLYPTIAALMASDAENHFADFIYKFLIQRYITNQKITDIQALLQKDDFFKNKHFKILPIQNWNKNTKFLLEMENQKYLLILGEKNLSKYKKRLELLGDYYRNLAQVIYINENDSYLLLVYYDNGEGIPLSKCQLDSEEQQWVFQALKNILNEIHSHKSSFINFSTRFHNKNWYDFIFSYMKAYADYALEQDDLTTEDYDFIFKLLEKNKTYFTNVPLNYLHGDINPDNVCVDFKKKIVYLIDFDDFLVGDSLYEYAKIMQHKNIPVFQMFKNVDNNVIYSLYLLREYLLGYCFKKSNGLDYQDAYNNFQQILKDLKGEV